MTKQPQSMYEISKNVVIANALAGHRLCEKELTVLPNNILFDCYFELFQKNQLCILCKQLENVDVFGRLLLVTSKRTQLFQIYQGMLEHGKNSIGISERLIMHFYSVVNGFENFRDKSLIDLGLRICSFYNEGGWYKSCIRIAEVVEDLIQRFERNEEMLMKYLECYHRKLHAEVAFKELQPAQKTYKHICRVIGELERKNALPNLAAVYANFSSLFYMESDYTSAIEWSEKALRMLNNKVPTRVIIEVLRQACKAYIVKRCFNQAGFLIKQALKLATKLYEKDERPQYADTLADYGFFLLNFDSTEESVNVYKKALDIRSKIFHNLNINIALAHEDLAYVLYVHEYSSGRFSAACDHADTALKIMSQILNPDHLLMASAKRVKALILEEVALDTQPLDNSRIQSNFLKESEELHKEALDSSFKTFGEKNVLTAKQYGNLGRLYQSMKKLSDAEAMHLKAIAIKEELLGENDYEVALSVGHLASLYNYQMFRYADAERLYKRSLEINKNLFGEAYSGLQYDYRGLAHVYVKLGDTNRVDEYEQRLAEWTILRNQVRTEEMNDKVYPIEQIIDTCFKMC